jgi:hypothetical protein
MTDDRDDVVSVAAGDTVTMELYKQALTEAGIESRVVGEALASSFGTAIPNSVEVWVHKSDESKAKAAIEMWEQDRGQSDEPGEAFPRPADDASRPKVGGQGPHGHYQKDPGTS